LKSVYDKYYQTENLFGAPYPELIDFLKKYPKRGKLLDLGCGQGRNAIPFARLGFEVTGMDISKVGIDQMMEIAKAEHLNVTGIVTDIYKIEKLSEFDFILLDSMFHFTKKDKQKEVEFINRIFKNTKSGIQIIFCVPNSKKIIKMLNETIKDQKKLEKFFEIDFVYEFQDKQTGHSSRTDYKMIALK